MTRKEVKALMILKGITPLKIAQALNTSTQAIYYCMSGNFRSKRIETALEKEFGMPISDIRAAWANTNAPSEESVRAALKNLRPQLGAVVNQ
jgi:hypothetical protein